MTVRVYVPASMGLLARFAADGGIGPAPVRAYAVTGWLRESWPEASQDEWEYAALMAAADDSAATVAAELDQGEQQRRRVVLVAEVERVSEDRESTEVSLNSAISMRLVRAVHADTDDVDVTAPESLEDLGWFAVQEITALLA